MVKLAALALLLTGCASGISGSTYTDGRFWYSNVKSASDLAGGPRQDVMIVVDHDGTVVERTIASGAGTLQTVVGAVGTVITAGGEVAGSALTRPARNTTSATVNGGTGTANATGSSSATGSATSSAGSTASGGTGGSGGSVSP